MNVLNCESLPEGISTLDQSCVVLDNAKNSCNYLVIATSSLYNNSDSQKIIQLQKYTKQTLLFGSGYKYHWKLDRDPTDICNKSVNQQSITCELWRDLHSKRRYIFKVDATECEFNSLEDKTHPYVPLIVITCLLLTSYILFVLLRASYRYFKSKGEDEAFKNGSVTPNSAFKASQRVQSIDTFRGMCILMMIFVNDGAGSYDILNHRIWDGLYFGDMVFPCFIWIMGLCMPLSLSSESIRLASDFTNCKNIAKRSFLLFFIGVSLNTVSGSNNLHDIRIMGVLQRFGIAYFVVGIVYILMTPKFEKQSRFKFVRRLDDIVSLIPQWLIMLSILAIHYLITFRLTIPGCEMGYVGPGGDSAEGKHRDCPGGAAGYIDRLILGKSHLLQNSISSIAFRTGPFDPEGLLGCLTTIFHTFLGVQAGKSFCYYKKKKWYILISRWIIFSIICGSIGGYLHLAEIIPINKSLWSISFVLVTTSLSLLLMSFCYVLIDVKKIWRGGPFRIPGKNAIALYIGSQVLYKTFPFHWEYGENMKNSHFYLLIACLWDAALWTIVACILHRYRIYIRL